MSKNAPTSHPALPGDAREKRAVSDGLPDYLRPGLKVLFVGINPGRRSAALGHHFAGHGNRFWDMLWKAQLVPERIGYEDDARLPEWGYGLTNIVARPTAGVRDLTKRDFEVGRLELEKKVRHYRPEVVAFVGVTAYRQFFRHRGPVQCGLQAGKIIGDSAVFVLPNTSGRNAHFSSEEMLDCFCSLARHLDERHS